MCINTNMETLVTVTFTRDKWCMALQAHSLELFIKEPCNHYVLIQDDSPLEEWEALLRPIYKTHTLHLMHRSTHPKNFTAASAAVRGWRDQQVLKMKVAEFIDTEKYLILDSKNIFVRPLPLSTFEQEGEGNCGTSPESPWYDYWRPWLIFMSEKLNKPIPELVWPPITPFTVNTNTVKKMLEESKFEQVVEELDYSAPISEFLLYSFYANPGPRSEKCYGGGYQGGNITETLEHAKNVVTFALRRFDLEDPEKRKILYSVLTYIGLDKKYVWPAIELTRN